MKKLTKLIFILVLFLNFSCVAEKEIDNKKDLKVLILGNSILRHSPAPSLGWYGDWGMAATIPENDFLHVYIDLLQKSNIYKSVDVKSKNIAVWENDFQYNLNTFEDINTSDYDFIILRLGENISEPTKYYAALNSIINFYKSENTKIIITGIVWQNDEIEDIQQQLAIDNHYQYISFDDYKLNPLNYSWGLFDSGAVASHPSDLGMKKIAELLYNSTIEQ